MNHNGQRGVALVFVLMLTTVAGLVVFTSLNKSATQERMAGNFQKNLNAEWQAERATFESFNRLNALVRANPAATASELVELAAFSADGSGARRFSSTAEWDGDRLAVSAAGERYEDALAKRKAMLRLVSTPGSSGRSPFASGVIGCDGVGLSGSADISSYSSTGDPVTDPVVVKTVREGADIELSGASEISGDILSTGSIHLGTSKPVAGSLHANEDITISSTSSISGTVKAVGDVSVSNSAILHEELHANGDIAISGFSSLLGGLRGRAELMITNLNNSAEHGDFLAMGSIALQSWIADFLTNDIIAGVALSPTSAGIVNDSLYVEPVPLLPVDQDDSQGDDYNPLCDPLQIVSEVQQLDNQFNDTLPELVRASTDIYHFNASQGQVLVGSPALDLQPLTLEFLEVERTIYALDTLSFGASSTLRIDGNIALYVRGDTLFSGASVLHITEGSSLTLISHGTVDMSAGLTIVDDEGNAPQGINVDGYPVLAIYSGYQSQDLADYGVRFQGGVEDAYAAIYAPEAHVEVGAALRLRGAFVGKTIQLTGDGHLLFDQALAHTEPGGGNTTPVPPRFVFEGWF